MLVSGPIGADGIAIMSVREGLEFGTVRTGIGGTRIVHLPLGEQLPRIC